MLLTNLQQILGEIRYRLLYAYIIFRILVTQTLDALLMLTSISLSTPVRLPKAFLLATTICSIFLPLGGIIHKMVKTPLKVVYVPFPIDKIQNTKQQQQTPSKLGTKKNFSTLLKPIRK